MSNDQLQPSHLITQLLNATGEGVTDARNRLWEMLYGELRRLAHGQLADEGNNCTLQPTSLVNEAYLRLVGSADMVWANRRHFFGAAAQAMRRIRIENARHRLRAKRGGGRERVPLDDGLNAFEADPVTAIAVDEALTKLEAMDAQTAEVLKLRFFAGLSVEQTAELMELSPRSIELKTAFGRAWLRQRLAGNGGESMDAG